MKYYILNSIERIKQYSKQLDAESILYNKSWEVLNEDNQKEIFIFRPNNDLLLSINGKVQKGKWELLPNRNLLIDINNETYLLKPQFVDNQYLSLQLSGNDNSLILIDEDIKERLLLNTLQAFEQHLLTTFEEKTAGIETNTPKEGIEYVGDSPVTKGCVIAFVSVIIIALIIIFLRIVLLAAKY